MSAADPRSWMWDEACAMIEHPHAPAAAAADPHRPSQPSPGAAGGVLRRVGVHARGVRLAERRAEVLEPGAGGVCRGALDHARQAIGRPCAHTRYFRCSPTGCS